LWTAWALNSVEPDWGQASRAKKSKQQEWRAWKRLWRQERLARRQASALREPQKPREAWESRQKEVLAFRLQEEPEWTAASESPELSAAWPRAKEG
jgi:hypothetical protein